MPTIYLYPFTDFKTLGEEGSRSIVHVEGGYIHDSEGHWLLDAMVGLWCVNLDYGHEELVTAATAQLRELPYYNNFFKSTHAPAVRLTAKLSEIAPARMNHVFFTSSGSEANDTMLRMARRYWALRGKPEKQWIIAEPIQGAGHAIIPPENYWPAVKAVLAKCDICW